MNAAGEEDQQLIAGIARGEEAALQGLLSKYTPYLLEYASSILKQYDDLAEEAVSDVFLALWKCRETLCITHSISAWLYSATFHQSLKILRKQAPSDEVRIDGVQPDELIGSVSVDQEIHYKEFMGAVEAVLEEMPQERRRVFQMKGFENIRYKEIGAKLGISIYAVHRHMIEARRQIVAALPRLGFENLWLP